MVIYNAKDWLGALRHFHTSYVIRVLLRRVLLVGAYGALVTFIDQHKVNIDLPIDGTFFSLLGILLSLLLVFRTNTAYDRFWEGRRQWGMLVNYSRNFAVMMDALLPDTDRENRQFFARALSNFAVALKGHLRTGVNITELEETGGNDRKALAQSKHVPSRIAALLMRRLQKLKQQRVLTDGDLITIRIYHQAFLDITGSCERIKNTPIPFSYSFFIKLFITLYLLIMPLVLVETYAYFTILATILAAYALLGVEMIGDEIEEPFGLDCNDLPLNQISQTIRRNMHEILMGELPVAQQTQLEGEYQKVN
ncbi:bestrophin family ion channel [Spirosoma sp.]|uniref:bestrophin family protein n=1 Tax=Spirosoma sp. TaxID=1899569 RepID=UPI002639A7E2|nr:bestrophin family ion channel [Spirosoma sp.]MCX6216156.1 bestrophin family ion channel [Spirosoma sp.]